METNSNTEYYLLGEEKFWKKWLSKFLFTLISVKLWGLIACTWVSTYLLLRPPEDGLTIDGTQWLTFNTTIWALIFGMKEIFRITERRDNADTKNLEMQIKSKEDLTRIKAKTADATPCAPEFTADGLEIVGEEPDTDF